MLLNDFRDQCRSRLDVRRDRLQFVETSFDCCFEANEHGAVFLYRVEQTLAKGCFRCTLVQLCGDGDCFRQTREGKTFFRRGFISFLLAFPELEDPRLKFLPKGCPRLRLQAQWACVDSCQTFIKCPLAQSKQHFESYLADILLRLN